MPFVASSTTKRLTPPAELGFGPDEWIEIRTVLTAGMRQRTLQVVRESTPKPGNVELFAYRQALLHEVVVAWSDPQPVTPEALEALPFDVADWISDQFDEVSAGRSEAEKKEPISPSSPTSGQAKAPSRQNSATS